CEVRAGAPTYLALHAETARNRQSIEQRSVQLRAESCIAARVVFVRRVIVVIIGREGRNVRRHCAAPPRGSTRTTLRPGRRSHWDGPAARVPLHLVVERRTLLDRATLLQRRVICTEGERCTAQVAERDLRGAVQ